MAVYKILIKGVNGAMAFATEKKEIMNKEIQTIDGEDKIVEVGTGKFVTGEFESEDVEVVKKKYVELMDTYKKDQLNCVIDVPEIVNITVDIDGENVSPAPAPDNNGSGNESGDNTTTPSQSSGDEGENNTDDETNNESGTGSDSDQNTGSEDTNASGEGTEGTDDTEETT